MDYINVPDAPVKGLGPKKKSNTVPGSKLYKLVAVSFFLLCVLQVALNIWLRHSDGDSVTIRCNYNLTEDADELTREVVNVGSYIHQGWVHFPPNFYYISSEIKNWSDSRDDCLRRGADLVVINSREEQDFVTKFHGDIWIGLAYITGGEWRWVDSTPLTNNFWRQGEPNGFETAGEDCVEILIRERRSGWNDITCKDLNYWICEKNVCN